MTLKIYFLESHLDDCSPNCGAFSDEDVERFHQLIKEFEKKIQDRYNSCFMAECIWSIIPEETDIDWSRKLDKKYFSIK